MEQCVTNDQPLTCMCTSWSRVLFLPASRVASFFVSFPVAVVVVVLVLVVVVVVAATAVGDAAVGDNDAAAAAAVGRTASGIVPAPELPMLLSVVAGVDRFDGDAVAVVVAVVAVVVVLWSLPAAIELLLLALPLTIP